MSERDFAMALAMLAEAFGEKGLTPVRIEAYHRSLSDIPLPVLNHAVKLAIDHGDWFPKVAQFRRFCEQARLELRASVGMPDPRCEGCTAQGFTEETIDGVKRMVRCQCWTLTQRKVAELGIPATPLALPHADEDAA